MKNFLFVLTFCTVILYGCGKSEEIGPDREINISEAVTSSETATEPETESGVTEDTVTSILVETSVTQTGITGTATGTVTATGTEVSGTGTASSGNSAQRSVSSSTVSSTGNEADSGSENQDSQEIYDDSNERRIEADREYAAERYRLMTEEKENAENALADVQARLDTLNAELESTRQKLEDLRSSGDAERYAEGSFGFFRYVGADDALNALSNAKYASSTVKGDLNDATSMENMRKSFDYMRECNELRKSEGKGELLVTDELMAIAQSDLNWSDGAIDHSGQFFVGENLAWNYSDPFSCWYYDEKTDNGGHYENIVNDSYTVTGFAVCTAGRSGIFKISYGQVFDYSVSEGTTVYTVDEYENRFNEYYDSIVPLINGQRECEEAIAALEEEKADLQSEFERKNEELQQAVSKYEEAKTAYESIQ